ncbi:heavy metal transporter [Streptomyces sp. ISL-96]|uniref:heavy metal transporter n=1 Tax=Streptomyces sp. ISL-96 TaxID=2819191 RepID=UPI001BEA27CA|nr:heavy metal transporter [Streptomyces sp. ISL-96]MBT2489255.1 heavy metal transporter [Streptomyces sp. ISL-96]
MPESTSSVTRGRPLRIAAGVAVLLALAGYLVVQYVSGGGGAPRCTVRSAEGDGTTYELSPEQAVNAAKISAVGTSRGLPERAVTIALATALQESALRNIKYGDRDSLGLFQQRPSQGWGTPKQILDPGYSSEKFYEHLEKVPGYSRLPLTVAAQRVQRSGFPQAYAKHEPDAALLAAALTGRAPASLTCSAPRGAQPGKPDDVRAALIRDFGSDVLPKAQAAGAQNEPDTTGAAGTAGATGASARLGSSPAAATVTVPVPAAQAAAAGDTAGDRRGWELAHWAVAHASELRIEEVAYAGRVWATGDSGDSGQTWQSGNAQNASAEVRITTAQ